MAKNEDAREEVGADAQIGRNLATFRGERSQKYLAEKMRSRGWKWSQATVWAIEKGERPLKLAEAHDLVAVLNLFDVSRLLSGDAAAQVNAWTYQCSARSRDLIEAVKRMREAQINLTIALENLDSSGEPMTVGHYLSAESWLDKTTIETLVRQGTHAYWGIEPEADEDALERRTFSPDPDLELREFTPGEGYSAPYLQGLAQEINDYHAPVDDDE
ncbi:helix-turn-helix domain-containing protein [Demequina flava]|uniref:helix-turn-helix domain-containing protein n=1 Tax=Demequina flava TaxID=1095025 RepID=UPI000781DBBD|nr:helix-turn-helix transcriptional regulator [Demequina flava]